MWEGGLGIKIQNGSWHFDNDFQKRLLTSRVCILAGIAGGGPGYGNVAGGATAGTIYDPSQPIGSRWRQVADSQILRFYHSVATLTQNAEVLVTGSEATVDYRVQIYTPPYLQGGGARPTIGSAPTVIVPGTSFTIAFSNVDTIDRSGLSPADLCCCSMRFAFALVILPNLMVPRNVPRS